MRIMEVKEKDSLALEKFFGLPYEVYRHDPVWVPENKAIMKIFSEPATGITRIPLLAMDDELAVARLVCILHPLARDDGSPQGWIGYFEALKGFPEHCRALLQQAEDLLAAMGAATIVTPKTDNHAMGYLRKGFHLPQTFLTSHNPPYYPQIFQSAGYTVKSKSVSFYFRRKNFRPPKLTFPGIKTRELNRADLDAEIGHFNRLQNQIFSGRSGYIPRTVTEDEQLIRSFLPFLDEELIIFAEDSSGQPMGLLLCLPDVNQAIKGEKISRVRIVSMGLLPGQEGQGAGKAMGVHLMRNLLRKNEYQEAEASWIQHLNIPPQILALKFGARPGREFVLLGKKM
jgi:hypothetical protein